MSNGIIRRIDSLGRIVIPIHIRKKINLFENDNVEISINENNKIELSKLSSLQGNNEMFDKITESIYKCIGGTILIVDKSKIVSSYGEKKKEYKKNQILSLEMIQNFEKNTEYYKNNSIIDLMVEEDNNIIVPIIGIANSKIGALIYIYKGNFNENNRNIIYSYAIFISEMMKY